MTKQTEALKLALEALEQIAGAMPFLVGKQAITALREALAQQQEPWKCSCGANLYIDAEGKPRSTAASKQWVGLTDEERGQVYASWRFNGSNSSNLELCRAIEAKLREKNA